MSIISPGLSQSIILSGTNAAFFVRRFAGMQWSILTPQACRSIGTGIGFTKARQRVAKRMRRVRIVIEDQWKTYYGSIFNPARLKVKAMLKEMPKKYWHNMPETALVSELIQSARGREVAMIEKEAIAPRHGATRWRGLCIKEAKRLSALSAYMVRQLRSCSAKGRNDAKAYVRRRTAGRSGRSGRAALSSGPPGQLFNAALAEVGD